MRLPDWQKRFAEFGQARASMPFSWGSNDCCTFAAAAVEAMTGINPMADFPAYSSEIGAARAVAKVGLQALATSVLGSPVAPIMATVGDVVLLINGGREMIGVCNGTTVAVPGEAGMVMLGIDAAIAAWKI